MMKYEQFYAIIADCACANDDLFFYIRNILPFKLPENKQKHPKFESKDSVS